MAKRGEGENYNPEDQLLDFMKENKTGHFNDEPDYNYKVSTGSLNLDIEMNGGPGPGIIRLSGISGGGKSAHSQKLIENFFKINENSRAVIIPSEGKRVENLARNQGRIKCVSSPTEWTNHSCFIYRTNIYERAFTLIRNLIENNPTDTRYIFVVDSIDALIPEEDFGKSLNDAIKVAGGALISSVFLKNAALMASARGHIIILISQVRAKIEINKYAPGEKTLTNASGGRAVEHYADWIMEFKDHMTLADKIWAGDAGKSKVLGHYCEIAIRKSTNNKVGTVVRYPIKYNPDGSGVIWESYELTDTLMMWEQIKKNGSWLNISEVLITELEEAGLVAPPVKSQGLDKLRKFFDDNPDTTRYLINKFREIAIP